MTINPSWIKRIQAMPTAATPDGDISPPKNARDDGIDRRIGIGKRRHGQVNQTQGPRNGRRVCSRVDDTAGRLVYRVAM